MEQDVSRARQQLYCGQLFNWAIREAIAKRTSNVPFLTCHPLTRQPVIVWLLRVDDESVYGHVYYRPEHSFNEVFAGHERGLVEIDDLRHHCSAWAEGTLERHHGQETMHMDAYGATGRGLEELSEGGIMKPVPAPSSRQELTQAFAA